MKNNILGKMLLLPLFALTLLFGGCYNEFDEPKKADAYSDVDFPGCKFISIKNLKQLFYDEYGSSSTALGKSYTITENYIIKGKVISTDANGNVYRTMYIQDETGAIEVKIGITTSYNFFKQGQTVYVKCKNLVLGNYRYMLSLGLESTDADYANGYISVWPLIERTIFPGEAGIITEKDILTIPNADYIKANELDLLGRLVKIDNLTSFYGKWDNDEYPSFLEQVDDVYTTYSFETVIKEWNDFLSGVTTEQPESPRPANLTTPTYAYNYDNNRYYGTALFKFGDVGGKDITQNLLVRSSGYAKFALNPIPAANAKVNITAIFTKYSSRTGGYIKYQLLLNSDKDVEVVK